jgi:predicted CXXCH cytochrome family protein
MDFRDSAHAQAKMTCPTCHGGNPNDPTASAMAASAGFKGRPTRQQIPEFCGSCHSDRTQMAQYGLTTHQLDDYKQSMHGKAWQHGDTNVAVCTDCHSDHRIMAPEDPRATVSRQNVATTCSRCHSDAALMGHYGLPATAYTDYSESIHARLIGGVLPADAPTCATCHASHAALPPNTKDIPNVCSRCHGAVKGIVESGPHGQMMALGAMSCASCHGYHNITPASDTQLISMCGTCHDRLSAPAQRGEAVYSQLSSAAAGYAWAGQTVNWLGKNGAFVEDLHGRLEEANMGLQEARRDQHALQPELVDKDLVATNAVVDAVTFELRAFAQTAVARKVGLVVFWIYAGLMILFLYWKRRRSEEHSD